MSPLFARNVNPGLGNRLSHFGSGLTHSTMHVEFENDKPIVLCDQATVEGWV
jgi:hypothetical protein